MTIVVLRLASGLLFVILALGLGPSAIGVEPERAGAASREFKPGTLAEIRHAHRGQPFLLKMWSVDCPPCVKDLDLLAKALRHHPQIRLVLVSVDDEQARQRVESALQRSGMASAESWLFGDGNAKSLRHEIDPQWYGELPRTYFYDARHDRVAVTGPIEEARLKAWLGALGD